MTTMSILMKHGDVKGDASDASHKNWIKIDTFSFTVDRHAQQEVGNSKRSIGMPSISKINLAKEMDNSTPGLLQETFKGVGEKTTLHFLKGTDGDNLNVFWEVNLENAVLSHYSISATKGSTNLIENLSLSFTRIEYSYMPHDEKGKATTSIGGGYDLLGAKAL